MSLPRAGILNYEWSRRVRQVILNMWMVKVESHREFWKCHANLLECGKCNSPGLVLE
jgi:hypothetical protein